jgi:hypothetical protein
VKLPAQPKTPEPEPKPGVAVDDRVYFHHATGPCHGRVLATGKHGITVDHAGKRRQVRWDKVLGHKERIAQDYEIMDRGEDGVIARNPKGKHVYIEGEIPEPDDELSKLEKSLQLLKANIKGLPGLALQETTDSKGRVVKRWKRTAPKEKKGRRKGASRPVFGRHNVEHGDAVKFRHAGDQQHHGHVVKKGKDGAIVKHAKTGLHHRVFWHEVEHHEPQQKGPKSAEDIARALFNTSELQKLPIKAFQPVSSWDELNAKAGEGLKQFKGMLDKVAGRLDLVTGKLPFSHDAAQETENAAAQREGRKAAELNRDEYMLPEHWDSDSGFLFMGPLKGEARAKQKVDVDYHGDWSQVRDMVRATIAVPMVTQIPKVLDELKKAGIELAQQPKNNLVKPLPGGYRDLNLVVKLPNGLLAELQVHVKPMTLAKEAGHDHYNVSREIEAKYNKLGLLGEPDKWESEDRERHGKSKAEQERIYSEAWKRAGGKTEDSSNLTKALPSIIMLMKKRAAK